MKNPDSILELTKQYAAKGDPFASKLLKDFERRDVGAPVLFWYCRTPEGWRYLPAGRKGVSLYPGRYVIREMIDGKRRYANVDGDPRAALQAARTRAGQRKRSHSVTPKPLTLTGQIKDFITRYENKSKHEAAKKASEALNDFQLACPDVRVAKGITQDHVLQFHRWLKAKGNVPRTVFNKHKLLHVFLTWAKVDLDAVIPVDSKPKFQHPPITVYEPEDIQKLLAHASPYMSLVIGMAHGLGLRERELMHVEFADILPKRVLVVQAKPRFKFTTKTHEHREVTIHTKLYDRLMAFHRQYPERRLILGVGKGYDTPSTGLLGRLKRLAKRAGVADANLHKFRRTFITTLIRSGKMSLRDVQSQAGHSSLAATDRYAQALQAEKLVDPFDSIFG